MIIKKVIFKDGKNFSMESKVQGSFHVIWALPILSKLDINKFYAKINTMYIIVVLEPNFYLFTRSYLTFLEFFFHVYGEPF